MKKRSLELYNLAKRLYINRDLSHGIKHVKKVNINALNLCSLLNIKDQTIISKIEVAALFHDLWDQKYINNFSKEYIELKNEFKLDLKKLYFSDQEVSDIIIIINNISLSKEINDRKNNKIINLKHLQLLRDIVSDADKIEMLGLSGIERIVQYQIYNFPNSSKDEIKSVIKNIYFNKINKLLDENFIKTIPAKKYHYH